MKSFSNIAAIMLDMDGVLFHGMNPITGAKEFLDKIKEIPHIFITNNPILLPEVIADKMENMGFNRPKVDQILTSGEATAIWLSHQKKNFRYFAVGAEGLHQSLQKYGIEDNENADYVVIGEGEGISYEAITTGVNLLLNKHAELISTNPDSSVDAFHHGKRIVLPGGGALVAPFSKASGKKPTTIGKPFPLLYQMALEILGHSAEKCLMIGDRPDTDILGAQKMGIQTALVRTGRFQPGEKLPKEIHNLNWDVGSLHELLET